MRVKHLLLTAGLLLASAGAANAATVTNDLNLRSGPGTGYGVVAAMPAGSFVDVVGCAGSWCRVDWRGIEGFASSSYLAGGGDVVYAAPPPAVYAAPALIGLGLGFGIGSHWHHHGYWHGGHHWRGGHHWSGGHHHH